MPVLDSEQRDLEWIVRWLLSDGAMGPSAREDRMMGGLAHRLNGSPVGRFAAKLNADSSMTGAIQIAW